MASILKVDNMQGITSAKTVTVTVGASVTQSMEQGLLKAWTVDASSAAETVGDSFNNSSFSDDGTGKTTITLTNPFNTATDWCTTQGATVQYPYNCKAITSTTHYLYTVGSTGSFTDGASNGQASGDLA